MEKLLLALAEHEDGAPLKRFLHLFEAMKGSGGPDGPPVPPPPPPPPPPKQRRQEPLLPQADVRQIEDYADQLYEDRMELKVYGVKCILRVCTEALRIAQIVTSMSSPFFTAQSTNLELLADHENLLQALKAW